MEIERKFLVKNLPVNFESYPHHIISQGYISTSPVIRIRRSDDRYILTVKSQGLLAREEFETEITAEQFENLSKKVDGNVISKIRYKIPEKDGLTIELDIFKEKFDGLIYAEVEFPDIESAQKYNPPAYFGREVTNNSIYQNSSLSSMSDEEIKNFFKSL
ncbi:CYTH domain-containing protein [Eubacterium ruminantium]|uniref:CYTH domain-containing protein n=1 Tax=Eubacterium ruminantium TaxID=42322 RepID=A0A1T4K0R3_9FIRM|nr:CYTH domain-containing protein [Eubacterium ruminantium]SCW28672.1 CYTH domain-containing protein [Eubacterium ruminantium]SDM11014.1 CYTH domain-containing protein [Eubacterium ruminantium]SJZ35949.1 CYTH domain-containing protein [Eubacterium ruminantium]